MSWPTSKKVIGSKWVCKVKVDLYGFVACFKACLIAKFYAQTYRIDYSNTFSYSKPASIHLFISLAPAYDWLLHQLNVKNVFLSMEISKRKYMEHPPPP